MDTIETEQYLLQFRQTHGGDAWKAEVKRLALQGIKTSPKHEEFWKDLTKDFDWLNWDTLKQEAFGLSPTSMVDLLKAQMPGIKSQAQYNAVVGAFDAIRFVLNAILTVDKNKETEARRALEMALDATTKATELTLKLEGMSEATNSKLADVFKKSPIEFHEYDIQRKLLAELERISNLNDLNNWYIRTREQRDQVITQDLRDILMDSIRAKKNALEELFSKI